IERLVLLGVHLADDVLLLHPELDSRRRSLALIGEFLHHAISATMAEERVGYRVQIAFDVLVDAHRQARDVARHPPQVSVELLWRRAVANEAAQFLRRGTTAEVLLELIDSRRVLGL